MDTPLPKPLYNKYKNYKEAFEKSIRDPENFWKEAADDITWFSRDGPVLESTPSQPHPYTWFGKHVMNTCYNMVDRHVLEGRGNQAAIIYDSPVTNTIRSVTYSELLKEVQLMAGALQNAGVKKGDRVVIYMPMTPEAIIGMLACARIGAIHSVVFGGFAAPELAKRIIDAQPKLILSSSVGLEPHRKVPYKPMLDEALAITRKELGDKYPVPPCVIFQRPQHESELVPGRDHEWKSFVEKVGKGKKAECVPVLGSDPLYILYTSGTTGKPKGIVRPNGGHAVAMKWSMRYVYDMLPGEAWWSASDLGWAVGHSYIVYAPLFLGLSTVLYEGKPVGTPDPGAFFRVIEQHKVRALFTAPTALRAIKKEDANAEYARKYNLDHFRVLYLAGERADPDSVRWANDVVLNTEERKKKGQHIHIVDNYWQTETGWAIVSQMMGIESMKIRPGSASVPAPGSNVVVLDDQGKELPRGEHGTLAIKLPMAPGNLPTCWNDDERARKSYFNDFPGYYNTSDAGYIDQDGYVHVMARTDDLLNVAGHRLSTGALEEVLCSHPAVAESAVIGIYDPLKAQTPLGLCVLKTSQDGSPLITEEQLEKDLVKMVRSKIGPVASFHKVIIVQRLPKTRSGKILRGTMRCIADHIPYQPPATIEDDRVLDEIRDIFAKHKIIPEKVRDEED